MVPPAAMDVWRGTRPEPAALLARGDETPMSMRALGYAAERPEDPAAAAIRRATRAPAAPPTSPYSDVERRDNVYAPQPRPAVTGEGFMASLARKFGVSEPNMRLGLISAGLGMIAQSAAPGAMGLLGAVAGGAQHGVQALMQRASQEDTARHQQEQLNLDIRKQQLEEQKPFQIGETYLGRKLYGVRGKAGQWQVFDQNGNLMPPGTGMGGKDTLLPSLRTEPSGAVVPAPAVPTVTAGGKTDEDIATAYAGAKPEDFKAAVAANNEPVVGAEANPDKVGISTATDAAKGTLADAMAARHAELEKKIGVSTPSRPLNDRALRDAVNQLPGASLRERMNMEATAKGIANGTMKIPGQFARNPGLYTDLIRLAQIYDPTFNEANYPARMSALKDFMSGQTAKNLTRLGTVGQHTEAYYDALMSTSNEGFQGALTRLFNKPWNEIRKAGMKLDQDPRLGPLLLAQNAIAGELEGVFRGNVSAVQTIEHWRTTLPDVTKLETGRSALSEMIKLVEGRADEVLEQYNRAFANTRPAMQMISPRTREVFDVLRDPTSLVGTDKAGHIFTPEAPSNPRDTAAAERLGNQLKADHPSWSRERIINELRMRGYRG